MSQQESNSAPAPARTHERYVLAAVLGITALTYIGTLQFDFVSDDSLQIADNSFIKSWRYVPHYFVTSVWAHLLPHAPHSYYRPIYLFWNLVNYSLFKLNPVGWHATTLLLHLVVTALVYMLVRRLVPGRPAVAWLAALIFGVHPVHHEVVAWISAATESLCAALFLGAFLAYWNLRTRHRIAPRIAWMALSCVLYTLAMFAKETAIVLPALVFAHAWLAGASDGAATSGAAVSRLARAAGVALVYAPFTALYLVMRFHVLTNFDYVRVPLSTSALLFTWPSILLFYLKHWLLPFRYSAYYDFEYYGGLSLTGVILPAALLLAMAAALWLGRRRLGAREVGYAVAWMIIPLLPALDLGVFPFHEAAHDRYFYLPSIGAALLIALLLEPIGRSSERAASGTLLWGEPRPLVTVALLLTAALSFSAAMAANQWVNDLTMLTRARQFAPHNYSVRDGLAAEWIAEARFDDAKALLDPLVREAPQDWLAWLNLARADYQQRNYAATQADLRNVTKLNPDSGVAYILLGQMQIKTGRMPDALVSMRRGVELLPDEFRFRIIYGAVLQASGDCPSAVRQFNAALALQPREGMAERGLAMCHAVIPSSLTQPAPITR